MYRVIERFRDLTDRHLYEAGDAFPHDGREIPPERIEALETGKNAAGRAFIAQVKESVPADPEEAPKPRKVGRKKS